MKARFFRIQRPELTSYLLNAAHPAGVPKFALFRHFKFRADSPDELGDALLEHAVSNGVARKQYRIESGRYGLKFIVHGLIEHPAGGRPMQSPSGK